ncbi:nucleotidyltransferase domain-containing protein [Bacillus sp. N9]
MASRYPDIQAIMLFGSRVHGDYNDMSDIDLAVKAPGLSELEWIMLTEQVENELDTLLKIDLILYDQTSDSLREQIDQCYEVLYTI